MSRSAGDPALLSHRGERALTLCLGQAAAAWSASEAPGSVSTGQLAPTPWVSFCQENPDAYTRNDHLNRSREHRPVDVVALSQTPTFALLVSFDVPPHRA